MMSWRFLAAGGSLVVLCLLLWWVFRPAITSSQRDRLGTKADQFYFRQKRLSHEFAQQIFSPPSCDLTLVVPAYNEEDRLPVMLSETIRFLKEWTKRSKISYEVSRHPLLDLRPSCLISVL